MGTRLMTTAEVAKLLKLNEQTVRKWRSNNFGPPYFKVGRSVRYDRRQLFAWMEKVNPSEEKQEVTTISKKRDDYEEYQAPRMNFKRTRYLDVD